MNETPTHDTDVLVVGAGPTGLVLALWLTRLGVRVRIVDQTAEPGTTSRAIVVQARTLELYRQIDLADAVVQRGRKMVAAAPVDRSTGRGRRQSRAPDRTRGLSGSERSCARAPQMPQWIP